MGYISPNDKAILEFLFKNKIATTKSISYFLFARNELSSTRKRLNKMNEDGYIAKKGFFDDGKRLVFLYHLTKKGLQQLDYKEGDLTNLKFKSECPNHDLELIAIRSKFEKARNGLKIYSENEITFNVNNDNEEKLKPFLDYGCDATMKLKKGEGSIFIAIEYEASLKTKSRYKDLFAKFYDHDDISLVLYVCKTEKIKKLLIDIENKINDTSRVKLYYISLDELYKENKELVFFSRQGRHISLILDPNK